MIQVDVDVDGPHRRTLRESISLPDGAGTIGTVSADALVDGDGDGTADRLDVTMGVDVAEAGEFHLSVDLAASDGTIVASAPASATLAPGAGALVASVDLAELRKAGYDGPYEVRNAVLTHGSEMDAVADRRTSLGSTGPADLDSLPIARLGLGDPVPQGVDEDGDGAFDLLEFTLTGWIPTAGDYYIEASLVGPAGERVETTSQIANLAAGRQALTLAFPSWVVQDHGTGQYTLTDLGITNIADVSNTALAPVATVEISADEWTRRCDIDTLTRHIGTGIDGGALVDDFECVVGTSLRDANDE
ncbi:MAG TPA: hypothetical protein VM618_13750 [Acidimicrobiia bacterium]|nr:hypothetical protein [Acidimicrobiia bacterium]